MYILLYGLIYFFFTVQISWKIFFSGANSDLFILFVVVVPSYISVVVLSIGDQRISPFGAYGSPANRRTAGKTGLKGWFLSVFCSKTDILKAYSFCDSFFLAHSANLEEICGWVLVF